MAERITMEIEGAERVSRFIRTLVQDQLPFIESKFVNQLALGFQGKQRDHMASEYEIRRKRFMERSVKLKPFASKRDPAAKVAIDSPGGNSDIFAKFEEGGTKRPRGSRLAIPISPKRTPTGVIRKRDRPRHLIDRLDMKPIGRDRVFSKKGTGVWVGKKRTFMIRKSGGGGGIFRRTGPRRGDYEPIYIFTPAAQIEASLDFVENAREHVQRNYEDEFHKAFMHAMRTAR